MLSINAQGGVPAPAQVGGAPPPPQQAYVGDSIQRHEVNTIINNQNIFLATVRDIKTIAQDVQSRTDKIIQNQSRQPTAQIQGNGGYDVQSMIVEMRDGLNQVKQGIAAVGQKYVLDMFIWLGSWCTDFFKFFFLELARKHKSVAVQQVIVWDWLRS